MPDGLPILEITGVSKTYKTRAGDVHALSNASLTIGSGDQILSARNVTIGAFPGTL